MVNDRKAEELEAKGLYRRAAARWLEVMLLCTEDDDREWINQRASRRMNIANCAVSKVTTENETDTNSQTIPKAAPFLTS